MIMKMTNEELKKYPFPNLMAEISESGYSICTLGDFMGLGSHCEEDDPKVWGKLRGDTDLYANEAIGLVRLFGCTYEYLFSNKLSVKNGKSLAYHRWRKDNIRSKYECEAISLGYKILEKLKKKPYMYGFMKMAVRLNEDEIRTMTKMMSSLNKNRRTV